MGIGACADGGRLHTAPLQDIALALLYRAPRRLANQAGHACALQLLLVRSHFVDKGLERFTSAPSY